MRVEVLIWDGNDLPFYTGDASGVGPVTAALDYVLFGDNIEVKVKSDDGALLGTWTARNVYPANVVTATQFADGSIAVVDNASNTYTKEVKNAA